MSQVLQWTQFCALIWKRGCAAILDQFIDAGRAIARRRLGIASCSEDCATGVAHQKMHRLVLLMVGVGKEHRGEPVEGEFAVGFGIGDPPALAAGFSVS